MVPLPEKSEVLIVAGSKGPHQALATSVGRVHRMFVAGLHGCYAQHAQV